MDWMIISMILIGMMPMTMATGYLIGDPIWKCKILNKIKKGSFHGIVFLDGWGNNALMMIKDLRKDLLAIGDDVYALQDHMIINLKKPTLTQLKLFEKHPEALLAKEECKVIGTINKDDMRIVGGVPFVELDKNTMLPVQKSTMNLGQSFKNMLPGRVGATLKTEVAVARAKAYNEQGEQMKKILIIVAIIAVAAAGIGALNYISMNNLAGQIQIIFNRTADILSNQAAAAAIAENVVG